MTGKNARIESIRQMKRDADRASEGGIGTETPPVDGRPRTRADCEEGMRPCPFLGCRHNLMLDVSPSGSLHIYNHTHGSSCALDEANRGGMTMGQVGGIMGITRERIRQIQNKALGKIKAAGSVEDDEPDRRVTGLGDETFVGFSNVE